MEKIARTHCLGRIAMTIPLEAWSWMRQEGYVGVKGNAGQQQPALQENTYKKAIKAQGGVGGFWRDSAG